MTLLRLRSDDMAGTHSGVVSEEQKDTWSSVTPAIPGSPERLYFGICNAKILRNLQIRPVTNLTSSLNHQDRFAT